MSASLPWQRALLHAQIAVQRCNAVSVLAWLLCAVGVVAWAGVTYRGSDGRAGAGGHESVAQLEAKLRSLQRAAPPALEAPQGYAAWQQRLGDAPSVERDMQLLFKLARESGISLGQGEYKWLRDAGADVQRYQIRLPLKARYSALRRFCERALAELPYLSLDEVQLKRETIAEDDLAAILQFTLHLRSDPVAGANAGVRP